MSCTLSIPNEINILKLNSSFLTFKHWEDMYTESINGACILKSGDMMRLRAPPPPPPGLMRLNKCPSLRTSWVVTLRTPVRRATAGNTNQFPTFMMCIIPTVPAVLESMLTCLLPSPSAREWWPRKMWKPLITILDLLTTTITTLTDLFMILIPSGLHSSWPMLTKALLPMPCVV